MNATLDRPETDELEPDEQPDLSGLSPAQLHFLHTSHTLTQFTERLDIMRRRDLEFKKAYTRLLELEQHRKRNRL